MPRLCLAFVGLLAVSIPTSGFAQTGDDFTLRPFEAFGPPQLEDSDVSFRASEQRTSAPAAVLNASPAEAYRMERLPPLDAPLPSSVSTDDRQPKGEAISLDESKKPKTPPPRTLQDFWGYRYQGSSLGWIPGGGDQFGMFAIEGDHYVRSGETEWYSGLGVDLDFYALSGPVQTDMPAWVFDFGIGYQFRKKFGDIAIDLATSVVAASDFKGCARKGILFPSHAVGFLAVGPTLDLVFGVDYLDRGDVKLLPVGGVIWKPSDKWRFEAVFPRPRAYYQLSENYRVYVTGELGGGTWAIERATRDDDLATYHDLRVGVGLEQVFKGGYCSAIEVDYLFDRRIEYTSRVGNMPLDGAVMIRLVTTY
jgi:hypothetical protein